MFSDSNPTFYVTVENKTNPISTSVDSEFLNLYYDTSPPMISNVETRLSNNRLYLTITAIDPGKHASGIVSHPLVYYKTNISNGSDIKMYPSGGDKYEASISVSGAEEINYKIIVQDAQGNTVNYSDVYYTVFRPEKEIQKATGISKAGVNLALRKLAQKGLVERKKRGRMYFYSIQLNNPFIKQLKILQNIARLWPLVKKLKKVSQKIILFGSWSRGENLKESDIDLCILTNFPEEVQEITKKSSLKDKLQLVIRTPTNFAEMEKKDPVFFKEIDRGIVLFSKEFHES